MLANIRVRDPSGNGRFLCQLDLLKFSQEQVRERMVQQGYNDENFFVAGIEDWGIDAIMSLSEAYTLKKAVSDLYAGDETVVIHLMQKFREPRRVFTNFYEFVSKDEKEVLRVIAKSLSSEELIELFIKFQIPANVLAFYIEQGSILNVPTKGYYALTHSV